MVQLDARPEAAQAIAGDGQRLDVLVEAEDPQTGMRIEEERGVSTETDGGVDHQAGAEVAEDVDDDVPEYGDVAALGPAEAWAVGHGQGHRSAPHPGDVVAALEHADRALVVDPGRFQLRGHLGRPQLDATSEAAEAHLGADQHRGTQLLGQN